jgi:hypothetical protein
VRNPAGDGRSRELRFQLVAHGHHFVDFSDDAAFLGEGQLIGSKPSWPTGSALALTLHRKRRQHAAARGWRSSMTRNMLLRLELFLLVAMASAGCQVVEGIFKAGMWVGILLVVVVLGIVFMVFGRSST